MKYKFRLQHFPNSDFEIDTSVWTGKSKLFKDNVQIEQSKEKGKPFLIPTETGEVIKAFPKQSFPDLVPALEINDQRNQIVDKLKWFQYALGMIPVLLVFIGGGIGGAIGFLGMVASFNVFRQEGSETSKYLKVIGVVIASYAGYFTIAILIALLVNK